jgi:hypothetical protein
MKFVGEEKFQVSSFNPKDEERRFTPDLTVET